LTLRSYDSSDYSTFTLLLVVTHLSAEEMAVSTQQQPVFPLRRCNIFGVLYGCTGYLWQKNWSKFGRPVK